MLQLGLRLGLEPGNGVFLFSSFLSSLLFFLSQTSWCMGPVSEGTPREDPGTSVGNTGHPSSVPVNKFKCSEPYNPNCLGSLSRCTLCSKSSNNNNA